MMKTFTGLCGLLVIPLLTLAHLGCEVSSAGSASEAEIQINPNHAVVHYGESVEFTASGWSEYTWSLGTPGLGVLSHTAGDTTVYTAVVATTNGIQTLTCTATMINGTNSTSSLTATALIEHQ